MAGSFAELVASWVHVKSTERVPELTHGIATGIGYFKSKVLGIFAGIEDSETRARITQICSLFPHPDYCRVPDITLLYHDALEFIRYVACFVKFAAAHVNFRPGAYLESTRLTVMSKLLLQIRSQNTSHLIKALRNQTRLDLEDFFFQTLSSCMSDIERM